METLAVWIEACTRQLSSRHPVAIQARKQLMAGVCVVSALASKRALSCQTPLNEHGRELPDRLQESKGDDIFPPGIIVYFE